MNNEDSPYIINVIKRFDASRRAFNNGNNIRRIFLLDREMRGEFSVTNRWPYKRRGHENVCERFSVYIMHICSVYIICIGVYPCFCFVCAWCINMTYTRENISNMTIPSDACWTDKAAKTLFTQTVCLHFSIAAYIKEYFFLSWCWFSIPQPIAVTFSIFLIPAWSKQYFNTDIILDVLTNVSFNFLR